MNAVGAAVSLEVASKLQTPPPLLGRKGVALLKTTVGDHPAAGTRLPGLAGNLVFPAANGKRHVLPVGWSSKED